MSICVALGEPAYEMYKFNIDWSPSQHLGYDKLSLDSAKLAQAQQRASKAVVRAEQGNPSKYFSHRNTCHRE